MAHRKHGPNLSFVSLVTIYELLIIDMRASSPESWYSLTTCERYEGPIRPF